MPRRRVRGRARNWVTQVGARKGKQPVGAAGLRWPRPGATARSSHLDEPTRSPTVQLLLDRMQLHPLRLDVPPGLERNLILVGLTIVFGFCAILLASVAGWQPSGGNVTTGGSAWMSRGGWRAAVTRLFLHAGIGMASVLIMHGVGQLTSWWRRALIVPASGILFTLAAYSASYAQDSFGEEAPVWANATTWTAQSISGALPFLPLRSPRQRRVSLLLAGAPALLAVGNLILLGVLTKAWTANVDARNDAGFELIGPLEALLLLYLLWSMIEWSRVVGRVSITMGKRVQGISILIGLLTVKAFWLASGYANILPKFLAGGARSWSASRADGIGSWLTAGLVAGLACLWLVRRKDDSMQRLRKLDARIWAEHPSTAHLLVFAGILAAPSVAFAVLKTLPSPDLSRVGGIACVVVAGVALTINVGTMRSSKLTNRWVRTGWALALFGLTLCLLNALFWTNDLGGELAFLWPTGHYLLAPLFCVIYSLIVVVLLKPRRPGRSAAARSQYIVAASFLVLLLPVVAFHVIPRVGQLPFPVDEESIGATGDTLEVTSYSHEIYRDRAPAWESAWTGAGGTFELASLDTWLTFGLVVLVLNRRRFPNLTVPIAASVLVASSIVGHSATLAPTGWVGQRWYFLALILPVAAEFVFDARELNSDEPTRSRRIILTLSIVIFLLAIVVWSRLAGWSDPGIQLETSVFAFSRGIPLKFFLPALVAAVVAGAVEKGGSLIGRAESPAEGPER